MLTGATKYKIQLRHIFDKFSLCSSILMEAWATCGYYTQKIRNDLRGTETSC